MTFEVSNFARRYTECGISIKYQFQSKSCTWVVGVGAFPKKLNFSFKRLVLGYIDRKRAIISAPASWDQTKKISPLYRYPKINRFRSILYLLKKVIIWGFLKKHFSYDFTLKPLSRPHFSLISHNSLKNFPILGNEAREFTNAIKEKRWDRVFSTNCLRFCGRRWAGIW